MSEYREMSAAELGRGIGAGRIDPVTLPDAYLEAIATPPHGPRIYAHLTAARAGAEAQAAARRAREGVRRGPLDGVPISWKDLFDTAGTPTEAGSALLAGRTPDADAEVLSRAARAGLVCRGKTHMTELAFAGLGYNPITATPPNRYDADLLPGGSSSGAATSVGYGLAAIGIGSDTGGSVRVPSAWNDLIGLKTSSGLLPLDGVVKLCPRFDTVGPLVRTVEDAALIHGVLSNTPAPALAQATLQGARLLVLDTIARDGLDGAVADGVQAAIEKLAAAGASITERALPAVADAMDTSGTVFSTEAYAPCGELIETAPEKMFPNVLERFRGGRDVSAVAYLRAWDRLRTARADYLQATSGFDAVLVPTAPTLPPTIAEVAEDAEVYAARNLMALRNTRIGNLLDLCVLTLPTGTRHVGLSLMAPPLHEARLLRLGAAAEAALAS